MDYAFWDFRDERFGVATALVLKPYDKRRGLGWFSKLSVGAGLFLLAAFYGLLCSVLPPQLLVIPLVPVLVMVLLILWLLPDVGGLWNETAAGYLVVFVGLNALWPPIAALNLPGLPVVSPTRVVLFALLAVVVLNFAMSGVMRRQVIDAMNAFPPVRRLYWLFWATTVLALPLSAQLSASMTKWVNNQIYWTTILAASAWLATRPGFARRTAQVLAWTLIVVALLGINEYRMQELWWPTILPPWLRADEVLYAKLFLPSFRAYTTEYRVRGILGNALYTAEYTAICFPFLIYYLTCTKKTAHRMLLIAGVLATMMTMYFTSSRSAMIGMVFTLAVYPLLEALRVRRQRPTSLVASAVFYAYPLFAAILVATVIFWRRAHVLILGGYQHQASTDARGIQWDMGWPKVLRQPFGHGAGTSGDVLGFFNPGQEIPTVDSYFLTLLLDYGFLGFAFFFGLFALAAWTAAKTHLDARDEETRLLAPLAISFTCFLIIKSAASTEGSFPIMFMLVGIAIVLIGRVRAAGDSAARPAADVLPAAATSAPRRRALWPGVASAA